MFVLTSYVFLRRAWVSLSIYVAFVNSVFKEIIIYMNVEKENKHMRSVVYEYNDKRCLLQFGIL